MTGPRNRRGLLASALTGAAGSAVAIALSATDALAQPPAPSDATTLARLLEAERAVIFGYRAVLASQKLGHKAAAVARELFGHELTHAREIGRELRELGGAAASVRTQTSAAAVFAAHHVTVDFTAAGDETACLKLLLGCESAAEAAYFDALSKLQSPRLLRICAGALASEAQHAALLGELLYPKSKDLSRALPDPFITGPH